MSSHYLHALREGDRLNVFLDSADGFHLQEDVTKPMIFVSAGTGFAPMRAFLLGAAGDAAGGRPAGGSGAVQRHPLEPPRLHLPGRDRAVRGRGSARSRARRGVTRAAGPPRLRPGPDPRAGRAGLAPARRRAGTSTSAARSRCETPSAPPSPTSSRNTGGCRASTRRGLPRRAGDAPPATAPTSGADLREPAWSPRPHPDRRGHGHVRCSPPAAANCAASTRSRSGWSSSPPR